jgi:hypothetical protein
MQSLVSNRFRKDARALEEEEEIWFNEDDEFDGENIVPMTDMLKNKLDSGFDQINRLIIDKARTTGMWSVLNSWIKMINIHGQESNSEGVIFLAILLFLL